MDSEIETSEPRIAETPAAQRVSALACDEQLLPPPVAARARLIL